MAKRDTMRKYYIRGQLAEIFLITQWKDNCVYKTRSLGYIVQSSIDCYPAINTEKAQVASPSTKLYKQLMD